MVMYSLGLIEALQRVTMPVHWLVWQENRPYVGLLKAPLGYMVVEVFLDQRVMRVTERLTAEAVRTAS